MKRVQETGVVQDRREVAEGMFLLRITSPEIAGSAEPGQFVNIKALEVLWGPFLRRPFSISNVADDSIDLIFNVIGSGTRLLASRRRGDALDLLGPLGRPFGYHDDYATAVMVAGGLGIAPFPFLHTVVKKKGRSTLAIVGSRTGSQLYTDPFDSVECATDDGSSGFHGTVVDLLKKVLVGRTIDRPKIFGCGPTPMLKALSAAAIDMNVPCEISLEGDMACGIGLCQGCPVETRKGPGKYQLVCTEGPTFKCTEVIF